MFISQRYLRGRSGILGLEERRNREKERRRETILKAARRDFMKKGFKAVTVDSIAQRAQLSKGAIYLYFRSKEEIYAQVLIRDIEKFHDRVADIFHGGDTASAVLVRFAQIYTEFFLNERELFRILMTFMVQPNPLNISEQINDHIIRTTNKTIGIIERIFQNGIERGEFPGCRNIRQCRNALWGLLNGIIALHVFTGREETREERIRSTISGGLDIFLRGLTTVQETDLKS
jgi:AcrR family transcriptional regulator